MGCFDSVYVTCPYCRQEVEIQSKADACGMRVYSEKDLNIPELIVNDIAGENNCYHCNKNFILGLEYKQVVVNIPFIKTIKLNEIENENNESD